MFNWIIRNTTVWSFNCAQTNNWCLIELSVINNNTSNHLTLLIHAIEWLEIELFDDFTVCKQKTDV